jgi:hypothetical protein
LNLKSVLRFVDGLLTPLSGGLRKGESVDDAGGPQLARWTWARRERSRDATAAFSGAVGLRHLGSFLLLIRVSMIRLDQIGWHLLQRLYI